jgi:predicted porin
MKFVNKGLLGATLAILGTTWFGSAQAVPAFAHKYEKNCSYCHTAWPQLNAKGRKFKELGYRFKEDLKGNEKEPSYMEDFPLGAILVSRPYDKKSNGDRELHGLHEMELFLAGAVNKQVSTFFEFEGEDENDWAVEVGHAVVNYRVDDAVNLQFSWGPMFFADPYGTIVDHFSPTISHYALVHNEGGVVNGPAAADFGGADNGGALNDARHNVMVNGRVNKIFYIAGISGIAGSTTGEKDSVVSGRLAYDINDNMMIGALMVRGEYTGGVEDLSYSRTGIDFMSDFGSSRLQVGYITARDDQVGGSSTSDKVFSVQGMHTYKTEKGKPTWVPLARYENYTKNDGDDTYADLVLGVSYYLSENVKTMVEYKSDLDAPSGVDKENRATVQINLGL